MLKIFSHKKLGKLEFLIVRPMIISEKISMKNQKEYQSGVGVLLCLAKHSRPDIANATRELSKANNCANPALFKEYKKWFEVGTNQECQ